MEVSKALGLFRKILNDQSKQETWIELMKQQNDLMLIAILNDEIIGGAFGRAVKTELLVDKVAVDENHRGKGIAKQLVLLLEENAKARNINRVIIDSTDTGELFYCRMDYTGYLIVQSEVFSNEQLLSLNHKFDVYSTNVIKDGKVNQIVLRLSEPGGELQKKYIKTFPGCITYLNYIKEFR